MRPLKFEPVPIGTIWGGEDWILSAMEGRQTICLPGGNAMPEDNADEGLSLSELVCKYRERLVGQKVWNKYGSRFPLLVKYINSRQQLSVQVHPGDKMADRKGLPNGKTEMWYVLEAKKDSELLIGFSKRFCKQDFAKIVSNSIQEKDVKKGEKTLEDVLNRFTPKRGDWYFIPAGTVHSIGAGTRILEIQQPSDITYRLYDFNRVDVEGHRRHLDVEDALDAIDFEETQEEYVEVQRNVFDTPASGVNVVPLARCPHFVCNFISFASESKNGIEQFYHLDNSRYESFSVIVCTGGSGTLFYKSLPGSCIRDCISVSDGDLYLIPAELGAVEIRSLDELQIVETHLEVGEI